MKKTRILPLLLLLALLLVGCGRQEAAPSPTPAPTAQPTPEPTPTPSPTPIPTPTPKPISPEVLALMDQNNAVQLEKQERAWMVGRLLIPSVGIDVALFNWGEPPAGVTEPEQIEAAVRQLVTDNEDSAMLYSDGIGNVVADHSNQDFQRLPEVKTGDSAYILSGDSIISLKCDLVTDATNTGHGITDADGVFLTSEEDYLCYTCLEDWTHVRAVGFRVTDEDYFDQTGPKEGELEFAAPNTANSADSTAQPAATPQPTVQPTETPQPTEAPKPITPPTAAPQAPAAPQNPQPKPQADDPYGGVTTGADDWGTYSKEDIYAD